MNLADALEIRPGLTSIIGSGGKSTMLGFLGRELARRGRVILCTTAKMYAVPGFPLLLSPDANALEAALSAHGAICAGSLLNETGKLIRPEIPMETLLSLCDYVIAEADGSAGLPLKAHAAHEPPVDPRSDRSIMLVGANGLGLPIERSAHRAEIFARIAGCSVRDAATPQRTARVLLSEGLYTRVFINRLGSAPGAARELAALLDCPVLGGELREGRFASLS